MTTPIELLEENKKLKASVEALVKAGTRALEELKRDFPDGEKYGYPPTVNSLAAALAKAQEGK